MHRDTASRKIKEYIKDKNPTSVEVSFEDGKTGAFSTCRTKIRKSYGGVGAICSFATMKFFSDLLGTEEINIENEYHEDGCESCDYGSYDECDLVCYNIELGDPNED